MVRTAIVIACLFASACHHGGGASVGAYVPPAHTELPPGPAPGPNASMRLHFIDVGQGASTLIEFSCGVVLVDTGGEQNDSFDSEKKLLKYLDRFFRTRKKLNNTIALLVLTHPHIDHTRSAPAVFDRYKVAHVVTDGLTTSSGGEQQSDLIRAADRAGVPEERVKVHDVPAGGLHDRVIDPISCDDGDPDIRALWGAVEDSDVDWSGAALANANNDSVVMRFRLGKASFIITGDLEKDGIASLVAKYGSAADGPLRSDVYEVGHHGSWNGTTMPLLEAIKPKIAAIEMGNPERLETWSAYAYGHPREETITLLEKALTGPARAPAKVRIGTGAKQFTPHDVTAPIYATGWDHDVEITLYADGRITTPARLGGEVPPAPPRHAPGEHGHGPKQPDPDHADHDDRGDDGKLDPGDGGDNGDF